jgi:hypothetical protein
MRAVESLSERDELQFLYEAAEAMFLNMDEQETTQFGA